MKKIFVILVTVILCLSLVACGGSGDNAAPEETQGQTQQNDDEQDDDQSEDQSEDQDDEQKEQEDDD